MGKEKKLIYVKVLNLVLIKIYNLWGFMKIDRLGGDLV